ncbi:hypothetical protein BO78DRAFT_200946 [Aspergillus sclerotiicarbonarius CBS 121057]|uniref:Uncharacterized protein n=1 Tax=Aspergillus sclerotiicarbonarius (strain CBS 121057 / IBT 28362) TaxID=1448318 RepID=A0A319ETD9_ASPSB|nr:hypothetical protein BO78DRAFT_200946 [Aspergillus sclerotiicarbonarius CBS 121057]
MYTIHVPPFVYLTFSTSTSFGPVAAFPSRRRVIGKLHGVGFFRVTGITFVLRARDPFLILMTTAPGGFGVGVTTKHWTGWEGCFHLLEYFARCLFSDVLCHVLSPTLPEIQYFPSTYFWNRKMAELWPRAGRANGQRSPIADARNLTKMTLRP